VQSKSQKKEKTLSRRCQETSSSARAANAFNSGIIVASAMKMKAIVSTKYGPPEVLEFKEVEKPLPTDTQVLMKVHAASISQYDLHMLEGKPFLVRLAGSGLLKPKNPIPGTDVAGRVEEVGSKANEFKVGDEVFGFGIGSFAEYACANEDRLVLKPTNVTFDEAAVTPVAGLTALQGLRDKGKIQAGQKVLINGASGGVGTFALQIAKSFGAEVTAVCSTGKMDTARSIGADHVIDYTKQDFTKSGERYDLILSTAGHHSIFDYKRALGPNGIYVFVGGSGMIQTMLFGGLISKIGHKKMGLFIAKRSKEDLVFLKDLLERGKVKPVIDRRYPLNDAPKALMYLEEGHAKGKIAITVA
jgi:NADPH:quinone reductase-like Zn-dependent oxidoreductase